MENKCDYNLYAEEQRKRDAMEHFDDDIKEIQSNELFLNAIQPIVDWHYRNIQDFVNEISSLTSSPQEFTMNFPAATITIKIK